jgi:hypothetical protein
MDYSGTFCTVTLQHVQEAYIFRGPVLLATLLIMCKPTSEARSCGQDFKIPTDLLAKLSC